MHIKVRATGEFVEYLQPLVDHADDGEADDNDVTIEIADGATIPDVISALALPADQPCMVVVEGTLIPTAQRATTHVAEGNLVVIMPPLKGG